MYHQCCFHTECVYIMAHLIKLPELGIQLLPVLIYMSHSCLLYIQYINHRPGISISIGGKQVPFRWSPHWFIIQRLLLGSSTQIISTQIIHGAGIFTYIETP